MTVLKLADLYQTVVLAHAQSPRHRAILPAAPAVTLRNMTCGDVLTVQLVVKADQIQAISFTGSGCTISQASASMLTVCLDQQSVAQAQARLAAFSQVITGTPITATMRQALGDAAILGTVAAFPTRIRCATLAWHAADQLLTQLVGATHD
ncbi:SUF system NifU family Fe-S cluster assembly protein [Lactobacillus sp. CBA3606]|uniref:Fe-S cluster assembly sulfur transfer protein SufU n=1 Tax=Lactobacillus sp. CBA3606 TaxID=2099789 RepID=UPI000CFE0CE7|nr:SUF system NifU family Fe-S cluster assembly protein [Lactobacillus sp. CBA3606]AVK63703.1 SUF system NifU family Fe-S cluster assembly protein [Lactobacillus sp. CBA3606]